MSTVLCIWSLLCININTGLPRWFSGKESTHQCRRRGFDPWIEKIPWRRKWQHTLVFLPGKFHGQRSQASYSTWARKESDRTACTHDDVSVLLYRTMPFSTTSSPFFFWTHSYTTHIFQAPLLFDVVTRLGPASFLTTSRWRGSRERRSHRRERAWTTAWRKAIC